MSSFFKDLSSIGITKVIVILCSLFGSVIIARTLGPDKNGIISSLLVYPSLFMTFGALGIRQSTAYFIGKKIYTEEEIKKTTTQIWFFTTTLSVLICYVLIKYFSNSGYDDYLIFLVLLPLPFNLFIKYNSGLFLGKNDIKNFNRINWIPAIVVLLMTALLVLLFSLDIQGYLLALICGPLIMFFILIKKNAFLKSFSLAVDWSILKDMLSLGIIYAIALLIINLNYKLDIILLDKLSTPFETGIYSKGNTIVSYLWQIPMLLSTIVFARSASSKNDKLFSLKVAQLLRVSFVLITLGCIVLFLFSNFIVTGLFGTDFINSSLVLRILIPGVVLLTIFKVMNMDLAGKGKPWVSLKAMVPALIINIVLNLLWIPEKGANGAALASTVSYSVAAVLFLFFYSQSVGISVKEIFSFQRNDFNPLLKIIKRR